MRLIDTQEREQAGDGVRGHRRAAVGVDGARRDGVVGGDGVLDEFFGQDAVLGGPDLPMNDFAGEDINDDVQQIVDASHGPFQFGDVPRPHEVGAVGLQFGFTGRQCACR
jgi:hypothetical protein